MILMEFISFLPTVGADGFFVIIYSGSQKSEVCPMPTEAYALCPMPYALCPMPSRTSSF